MEIPPSFSMLSDECAVSLAAISGRATTFRMHKPLKIWREYYRLKPEFPF
jgi:hypothetical protein